MVGATKRQFWFANIRSSRRIGDVWFRMRIQVPQMCRFSDAGSDEALDALVRPGSEKRQGTKSREGGAPSVPQALWGFGRGVRLDEVGSRRPPQSLCLAGWVWVTG